MPGAVGRLEESMRRVELGKRPHEKSAARAKAPPTPSKSPASYTRYLHNYHRKVEGGRSELGARRRRAEALAAAVGRLEEAVAEARLRGVAAKAALEATAAQGTALHDLLRARTDQLADQVESLSLGRRSGWEATGELTSSALSEAGSLEAARWAESVTECVTALGPASEEAAAEAKALAEAQAKRGREKTKATGLEQKLRQLRSGRLLGAAEKRAALKTAEAAKRAGKKAVVAARVRRLNDDLRHGRSGFLDDSQDSQEHNNSQNDLL